MGCMGGIVKEFVWHLCNTSIAAYNYILLIIRQYNLHCISDKYSYRNYLIITSDNHKLSLVINIVTFVQQFIVIVWHIYHAVTNTHNANRCDVLINRNFIHTSVINWSLNLSTQSHIVKCLNVFSMILFNSINTIASGSVDNLLQHLANFFSIIIFSFCLTFL